MHCPGLFENVPCWHSMSVIRCALHCHVHQGFPFLSIICWSFTSFHYHHSPLLVYLIPERKDEGLVDFDHVWVVVFGVCKSAQSCWNSTIGRVKLWTPLQMKVKMREVLWEHRCTGACRTLPLHSNHSRPRFSWSVLHCGTFELGGWVSLCQHHK